LNDWLVEDTKIIDFYSNIKNLRCISFCRCGRFFPLGVVGVERQKQQNEIYLKLDFT